MLPNEHVGACDNLQTGAVQCPRSNPNNSKKHEGTSHANVAINLVLRKVGVTDANEDSQSS